MPSPYNKGIYTVPEASRLLRMDMATIRRWAFGYKRRGKRYGAVLRTEIRPRQGIEALTFLELVELMYIKAFIAVDTPWKLIKKAAETSARLHKTNHPFAMKTVWADPAGVYTSVEGEDGEDSFIELSGDGQVAMRATLNAYLDQLDFRLDYHAERWFPLGRVTPVVLDPQLAFGAPTIPGTGIETSTLAAYSKSRPASDVAWWFGLQEFQVEAAIRFEEQLAAA